MEQTFSWRKLDRDPSRMILRSLQGILQDPYLHSPLRANLGHSASEIASSS
jgi:hypothetical protein